jgi:probable F420-dependent oxidoreductase
MRVETLLPLGKTDPGLRQPDVGLDLGQVAADARLLEEIGYDGLVVEETKDDPYVVMALAAGATSRLRIGTAVAMAFPRSPTVTAMSAWSLQKLSGGRFTLGLGSQVRAHIERRYGLAWTPAGPWMREYVEAVHAVWDCWQNGTRLDFAGERYRLNLMVPLFDPGPIQHPRIPIHLAAVNEVMCRVAGEVADGLRPHPVCTPKYIVETMLPAVRAGAARRGRELGDFRLAMKILIATAPNEAALQAKVRDIRARVAFYASTPAYRAAFAAHGLEALADELKLLARAQRWEEMPALVPDEVLNTYAVVGTYDEIAQKIVARYGAVATDVEFSIPVAGEADRATLAGMAATLRAVPPPKLVA